VSSTAAPGEEEATPSATLRSLFPADLPSGSSGDPGVIGPAGPVWRIVREKAILAGGPAALLLQVAHPLVAAGVVNHSDFESDPLGRLRSTLDSLLTVVFGDRAQAETAVAVVAAVHRPVRGVSPAGVSYRADDPGLALWVWATLVLAALGTFEDFVGPVSDDDKAEFYEEYKVVGRLFGVTDDVIPPAYLDFVAYVGRMEDEVLDVGDDARAIAQGIFDATVAGPTWWSRPTMQVAAAALLPPGVRRDYGLPWGGGRRAAYGVIRRLVRPALRILPGRARYWQHYRVARRRIAPPTA
jgi:uncharacterized protein (DUF2236 family)